MEEFTEIGKRACEISDPGRIADRAAESIKYFACGEKTFKMEEWKKWRSACQTAGKLLPPSDFKQKLTTK